MNFYNQMFNPTYINQAFYNQIRQQNPYNQDIETAKAVNAMHDFLEATKHLDENHKATVFKLCVLEIAKAQNWR